MQKGDHLVTSRIGYEHHGLYIGSNQVIHYAGLDSNFNKAVIEITSLEQFKQGSCCQVQQHSNSTYNAEQRISRAQSKLGEASYNLVFNNCEHFVNWCFDGVKHSAQVNRAALTLTTAANKHLKQKGGEMAMSLVGQASNKTAQNSLNAVVASQTVSMATGVAVSGAMTSSTVAGVTSAVASGAVASAVAPVAIAVGVGYGIFKVVDWLCD